jgi:hypothetical protein
MPAFGSAGKSANAFEPGDAEKPAATDWRELISLIPRARFPVEDGEYGVRDLWIDGALECAAAFFMSASSVSASYGRGVAINLKRNAAFQICA